MAKKAKTIKKAATKATPAKTAAKATSAAVTRKPAEATTAPAAADTSKPSEKTAKAAPASGAKKLSALGAAARVLTESGTAMNSKEMIEAMASRGYWTSPGGRTPHSTLYAAILREITTKGRDARFKKTEPGKFVANGS